MDEFTALDRILRYRIEKYYSFPVDWRDFPIFNAKIFDPLKIEDNFDWRINVAGIYAHRSPPAQVDVVSYSPFSRKEIMRLTCDTAGKLHGKFRSKPDFNDCQTVRDFSVRWGGSPAAQRLIEYQVYSDMMLFACAFLRACKIDKSMAVIKVPLVKNTYAAMASTYMLQNTTDIVVSLTFPIRNDLSGDKLVRHIQVVK